MPPFLRKRCMMDFEKLYDEIDWMPDSTSSKVDAIREAIRLADQANDRDYCHAFRRLLIDDAAFIGNYSDVRDALTAIAWMISDRDRHNEPLDVSTVESYQWIGRWLAYCPEIDKNRINAVLNDIKERLSGIGHGHRAYYEALLVSSMITDDRENADMAFKKYSSGKKDWIVRCDACISCRKIMYWRYIGDFDKAMAETKVYKKGESCNKNPMIAYNYLMAAAVETGRLDDIAEIQPTAYKMIAKDIGSAGYLGFHMIYFSEKNKGKGLDIYKKHLKYSFSRSLLPGELFNFELGAAALLSSIGTKKIKANLPASFPLYSEKNEYNAEKLAAYHYNRAKDIADAFDKRNKTSYYNDKLKQFIQI